MVQVIESTGPVPPEISAFGEGPAYLVIDPNQGSVQGRSQVEREIRLHYQDCMNIVFVGNHKLPDGRIVSVGQEIDPVAQIFSQPLL